MILKIILSKAVKINNYKIRNNIKIIMLLLVLTIFFSNSGYGQVKLGIDVLIENDFVELKNKRVLLFTNSTGRNSEGKLTAEILATSENVNLIGIITPEHGFFTSVPAGVKVENDSLFGKHVYSMYSNIKKPGNKLLELCDVIVADIQDIGVRSYTYISSLYNIMQAAAENNKPVIILDRPNPLGGNITDGNVLDTGMESFVGIVPVSYIHGLTIGELATMINEEGWLNNGTYHDLKCNLIVIGMSGYERSMTWEDTGLMWFPTSPNVPTVNSARGLAMIGIFGELGFISIGIGTTTPFQLVGSLDFDWEKIAENLDYINFSGIHITETKYNPQFAMYSGQNVKGIFVNFRKSENFKPYSAGIELFLAIRKVQPNLFNPKKVKDNSKEMFFKVTGTRDIFNAFFNNVPDDNILKIAGRGLDNYINLRNKYLIYK